MMSFQASGPHANDRALEAIALGLHEQKRFPSSVEWVKPMGKFDVKLEKTYRVVPRGISLAIGCSTFPVWNTVPGLYASLVTGNTALVKPHPGAIYPLALVVEEIRATLIAGGINPDVVQLAADRNEEPIAKKLAEHPEVKIIDYTGGNTFGDYIEHLKGKTTFTEKAGINSLVLHSIKDPAPVMQNISFALSLYSGQMCTCPQNIFVPKDGITVGGEHISFDAVVDHLCNAIKGLVTNEKMGPGTLGAVQSELTYNRIAEAEALGCKVALPSMKVANPEFPNARMASPAVLVVPADKWDIISREWFGPIVLVVPTAGVEEAVALSKRLANEKGAITFSAYTTDAKVMDWMTDEMSETFTSVSFNFTGPIWVNQSAGFSDFHVTGGNPAGNASLTDPEFVLRRFEIVGIRVGQG
jgi:phenylacetic acid degradation protein paaN